MFLRFAAQRLGEPSPQVEAALGRINSPDEWENLADRLLTVETWDELLAG